MTTFRPLQVVDSADVIFESSFGNVVLRQIENFKPSDELVREPFTPVGSQRPIGYTVKPGAQMVEFQVKPAKVEEVPWRTLHKTGEVCTLTTQYYAAGVKGDRLQGSVVVAECVPGAEGDQEGKYSYTVKLLVLGEIRAVRSNVG
jgi:hypothetical protein